MVRSLTSSDKFVRSLLDARDGRQDALSAILREGHPSTVFLSLNIPGSEKTPPGSEALFLWMLGEFSRRFSAQTLRRQTIDALGPYAIMALGVDPVEAKTGCVELETGHPSARLIDLDVYSAEGIQIDRGSLGLPGRACLVCSRAAVECIRAKRHSINEVIGNVDALLAHFRA